MRYVVDFETRNEEPATVWLWVAMDMETEEVYKGYEFATFFDWINALNEKTEIYFHNLAFDGKFVLWFFLEHWVEFVEQGVPLKKRQATTIISNLNVFYSLTYRNDKGKFIKMFDSYKLLCSKVEDLPQRYDLEVKKGSIDYNKHRPYGYRATKNELEYCINDCKIVKLSLIHLENNTSVRKSTMSAISYQSFLDTLSINQKYEYFEWWEKFTPVEVDQEIRKAYRGGFCRVNPQYAGKDLKDVYYYDVNSMYPYQMCDKRLPYGPPVHEKGEYKYDPKYPLAIQKIQVSCKIKNKKVPTILLNYTSRNSTYLIDSFDPETNKAYIELSMTNIELKRFKKHYEIERIIYIEYWKFKAKKGIFDNYIPKLVEERTIYKKKGNKPASEACKLQMNSLSGKFGENPIKVNKIPIGVESGKIKYKEQKIINRYKKKYLPMIIFITAYSREYIFSVIDKIGYDNWVYSDTDSIMSLVTFPKELLHNTKLGKFKLEDKFVKLKVIGPKTYYGVRSNNENVIKAAGATDAIQLVKYEDFIEGMVVEGGRHMAKNVQGGIKIVDAPFTIRQKQKG